VCRGLRSRSSLRCGKWFRKLSRIPDDDRRRADRLNKEVNAALADEKLKTRLAELGGAALSGSPAEFGKLIAEEIEKWGKEVRAAGIRAE
jgi:tripartite-type tricarboxylate transporter receptor subunit TctC